MATRRNRRTSRKTRKVGGKRKLSDWNMKVKKVYQDMKRKDRNASFSDALKAASALKRQGRL
jgi:hypothetical protein